jgi:hypothetical protein
LLAQKRRDRIALEREVRMATLLSWTSVGIGDLDVFVPSPPCLVVYTSYADDEPESSVTYFWQDENTGQLHHELVYQQPVSFETAVAWAQEHAPTRSVERIHVKHARARKVIEPKARAKPGVRRGTKKAAAKKTAAKKTAPRKAAAKRAAPTRRSPAPNGRRRKV